MSVMRAVPIRRGMRTEPPVSVPSAVSQIPCATALAERGHLVDLFDAAFFADTFGVPDIYKGNFDTYLRDGGQITYVDPLMVLPIMAQATKHLGLGTTLSTTFHQPYNLARTLASLDILSGGRVAWNIVTSTRNEEARNFGMEGIPAKDARYDRADEVLEACIAPSLASMCSRS